MESITMPKSWTGQIQTWQAMVSLFVIFATGVFATSRLTHDVEQNTKKNLEQDEKINEHEAEQKSTLADYQHTKAEQLVIKNELKNVNQNLKDIKILMEILIKENKDN